MTIGPSVQLFPMPDNPIPRNPTVMSVTADDGMVLRAAYWKPTTRKVLTPPAPLRT